MIDNEKRALAQEREAARQQMITRALIRIIIMLLGTLILVLLKRYGVL